MPEDIWEIRRWFAEMEELSAGRRNEPATMPRGSTGFKWIVRRLLAEIDRLEHGA